MALIGSVNNQGSIQGQINEANGYLTGVIASAELIGGQVVGMRGLKGDTGESGFSPIANVSKVGDTTTITITDENGTTSAEVYDGKPPVFFDYDLDNPTTPDHSAVRSAHNSGKSCYVRVFSSTDPYGDEDILPLVWVSTEGYMFRLTSGGVYKSLSYDAGSMSPATYSTGYLQSILVSGTNIKTINNTSLLGSGNIDIQGGNALFFAEYGVTTFADIQSAYQSDKYIVCSYVDSHGVRLSAPLLNYINNSGGDDYFIFSYIDDNQSVQLSVSSQDEWDEFIEELVIDVEVDGSSVVSGGVAVLETATALRDGLMTALDYQKLSGIQSGAEVNVQSDWNQSTSTADDYIKNKPTLFSGDYDDLTNKPTIPSNTSDLVNDSGFITAETDPVFSASASAGITSSDISDWNGKQDALVSGTNIKTINNTSLLGSGNIDIQGGGGDVTDVEVNGTSVVDSDGVAEVTVPTNTSELNNDSGFITSSSLPSNLSDLNNDMDVSDFPNDAGYITSAHEVPSGGSSGQVLAKSSNDDYDVSWASVSGGEIPYCTCADSASTVAKSATLVNGSFDSLTTGAQVAVKFTYTNTATNPTLNVNNTGAKGIRRGGTIYVGTNTNESWGAGNVVILVYDGTDWQVANWLNTTYNGGTGSEIVSGTVALNKVWSPQQIHDGIVGLADKNVQSDWSEADSTADDYIKNKPTIPSKTSDLVNDSGFITGYTETDPVFSASAAAGIASSDITKWNAKSNVLVTHAASASVALPASDSVGVTVDMTYSGYTFMGIVGISTSGTGATIGYLVAFYKSGNDAKVYFRNPTSTARNYTVSVYGLYVKV